MARNSVARLGRKKSAKPGTDRDDGQRNCQAARHDGEELRGPDRRWVVAKKRAEAVTLLVRHYNYRVTEVARYLGREQANVSLMLSRYAERMARGHH